MGVSQEGGGAIVKGNDTAYNILTTKQVSCTDSGTEIVTADALRAKLCLFNTTTNVVIYVGNTSAVTVGDGYGLEPQRHVMWPYVGALYGVVSAGSEKVSVCEIQT